MNAPDRIPGLDEMVDEAREECFRHWLASDLCHGGKEKAARIQRMPLMDVAVSGVAAVFPGRPSQMTSKRLS